MNELRFASQRNHVEYGKWLIASFLAIHGGAIYTISNVRNGARELNAEQLSTLVYAVGWHIVGICMIMLAGFMAWINNQCLEHIYAKWSNPAMLYRNDVWPGSEKRKTDPIMATLVLAAAFGLLSGFAFVSGALNVYQALY